MAEPGEFEVLDGAESPVEVHLPLGVASKPMGRFAVDGDRSPVVLVGDDARWVVCYRDGVEVTRMPILPRSGETVVVGF